MIRQDTPLQASAALPVFTPASQLVQPDRPMSSPSSNGSLAGRRRGASSPIHNPYTVRKRRCLSGSDESQGGNSSLMRRRNHFVRLPAERLFSQQSYHAPPPGIYSPTIDFTQSSETFSSSKPSSFFSQYPVEVSPRSVLDEAEACRASLPSDSTNKFFAVLIQNSIQELVEAAIEDEKDHAGVLAGEELLRKMCDRIKVPFPEERIKAKYDTPRDHMESRAGLVLEEARFTFCQDLFDLRFNDIRPAFEMEMEVKKEEEASDDPKKPRQIDSPVSFQRTEYKKGWFTARELGLLIPGLIVQCVSNDGLGEMLGLVSSRNNPATMARHGFLDILFFNPSLSLPPGSRWTFYPVGTSHINGARQFEAVSDYKSLVPFFEVIRGTEVAGDRGFVAGEQRDAAADREARIKAEQLQMPMLNESQQKAASKFLDSQDGTVAIVQGPPGTGKTTFCVGVICQYLQQEFPKERRHRILICAPTNKAISHIAQRFLRCMRPESGHCLNIIALGNEEKLGVVSDEDSFPCSMKSIHLYSWVQAVIEEFVMLKDGPGEGASNAESKQRADLLRRRLRSSLGQLPSSLEKEMDFVYRVYDGTETTVDVKTLNNKIDDIQRQILQLDQSTVRSSLMKSADIIFSTLSAARSSAAMYTEKVDCLIVDEAAACTEPALYIPFHLQPKKMLVVGDPQQLPAVVKSPMANRLGLAESFHERQMERLGCCEYVILDTQYRMKPEISSFPASAFYDGMLKNGSNVANAQYGTETPTLLDGRSYSFVHVRGEVVPSLVTKSSCNHQEAEVVLRLFRRMRSRFRHALWESADFVRVITFYKEQVSVIRLLLERNDFKNVSVGTVDSTQGCEANIVIVSFVKGLKSAGFLKDDRRINVALTRARHQLVCVGNVEAMRFLNDRDASTLRQMSSDASKRGAIVTF